ncbi:VanZ family protein [Comamonas endophytica]|uniref:VanZ family protein n=1 Tax=Comamonas endophytica TaxID=2949090 RepID=A0ABY6GET9_9BURK|nr:VanZ family protein [Acidovorax sp. 5MLIR]MCD2512613.1 VanZ family protein [Acidovorax sp. D4N7]UYG53027.1 VanZ family protein [Acidovorax sp. 5MLIR]
MHKTSAWPLALVYAALIVFASLFPFAGWRAQGINPWVFFSADIPPPYWTWFDVNINIVGYGPLGFLLALALLRSDAPRAAVPVAALAGTLLSAAMEFLQIYLPRRVPSNMDLALNAAGTLLGALLALALERLGAIDRWSLFRARWFTAQARGAIVLLVLWPVALLVPAAVPFSLGQVFERLESFLTELLEGTPFLDWLPLRDTPLVPLSPGGELLCEVLGLLAPCLLAYCVVPNIGRRAVLAVLGVGLGIAATALSAALSYGPVHAWEWLGLPAHLAIWFALALAAALIALPARACAAVLLLVLMWQLSLLNQAPTSAYFAQTLQTWEQGRFIRFYGLGQWLGWLWPYAALVYVLLMVARRERTSSKG